MNVYSDLHIQIDSPEISIKENKQVPLELVVVTGLEGPKDDKGDTGEQGPQGIQGEQGIQGIQGPAGQDLTGKQRAYDSVLIVTTRYSFCGVAPLGSLESDPVWTLTLLEISNDGLVTNNWVFYDIIWDDRLDYIPN